MSFTTQTFTQTNAMCVCLIEEETIIPILEMLGGDSAV